MKITINGRQVEVDGKKTLLEIARENKISIPSLCDHPALAPFGGCRLCLVEVKGRRGFPPACSTFAEEGMEVLTETPELQEMRRQVLELILSEHPHACLICSEKKNCDDYKSTIRKVGEVTGCVLCPKNGQCQLQEVVEALKIDRVNFPALYRDFEVRRDDPFFDRNYNLCILCGRCVRVCNEVRGASAISFVFRGSQAVVGTAFDRPLLESGCQFCGACVDVCPTGALTERAVRGELQPVEELKTICPLCSLGCELKVNLRDGRILSSKAGDPLSFNRGQVCVKGRFLIREVVYSQKRIHHPLIRHNGQLEETTWEKALDFVAQKLGKYSGKEIAIVGSPQVSLEDLHVLDRFSRDVLGTENIAYLETGSSLATFWQEFQEVGGELELNFEMSSLARAQVIVVAEADLAISHPVLWLEVYRALRRGAKLIVLNGQNSSLDRHASFVLAGERGREFALIDRLSQLIIEMRPRNPFPDAPGYEQWRAALAKKNAALPKAEVIDFQMLETAARLLIDSRETVFLVGPLAFRSSAAHSYIGSLWNLALITGGRFLPLASEINERACLEFQIPSPGKVVFVDEIYHRARAGEFRSLYLAGPLPPLPDAAAEFIIIQDCYWSENARRADAVLPAATFAEVSGTFINAEGRIQKFKRVIEPIGQSRPDWWIISSLAERLGTKNFNFHNVAEVSDEISQLRPPFEAVSSRFQKKGKSGFLGEKKSQARVFLTKDYGILSPSQRREPEEEELGQAKEHYRSLNLLDESKGLRRLRTKRER